MAKHTVVNGIDAGRLMDTIGAIKDNPNLAKFRFRAHNEWINGGHCRTTIQSFYGAEKEDTSRAQPFMLDGDEPGVLLGEDHGPNATEVLLHSLAACLNTTFVYHAAAKGISIDELEFEVEGDIDLQGFLGLSKRVRTGYQEIRVTCRVKSDASDKQIKELCQLAQRRSPVLDIVTHEVPVKVQFEALQAVTAG